MRKLSFHRSMAISLAGIIVIGVTALPAAAQTMKPGLWEISNKVGGSGDTGAKMAAAQEQMQKAMASMPPEQRKQMEKMMAQQGVSMAPGKGGGMSSRICVSKEMASRNEAPAAQGDCKQEQMQRSGNTTKFRFTCGNPPSTGEGEIVVHSPEAYTMKMNVTQKGQKDRMTMEAQGKWLGNDCGSLKPVR